MKSPWGQMVTCPLYPLGEPFQHGHVWQRRFVHTEPIGSRLDTQYKVNLGREVDATFFYNDQTGVLYRNGFYELIEVVAGEWIYDAISSLRRVHTSGIGPPVTPPIRTGRDLHRRHRPELYRAGRSH